MDNHLGLLLASAGLLMSCGTNDVVAITHISPELRPHVKQFYSDIDTGKFNNKFRYNLSSIRIVSEFSAEVQKALDENNIPTPIGVCQVNSDGIRYIQIRRDYWNIMHDGSRWTVVYHELVHCVLDKHGHDSSGLMAKSVTLDMTMEDFYRSWNSYNR